jgi:nitroreductase
MDLDTLLNSRRSYRALTPVQITPGMISQMATAAGLAPSCFNKQPWRFVFATDPQMLANLHAALSKGNVWANNASMIIAVVSEKSLDCVLPDGREYWQFDTGMATAFLILKATELGLVAHPIAGYDPQKTKEILKVPAEMAVITLLIVGKHAETMPAEFNEKQIQSEKERPERLVLDKIAYVNKFSL